MTIAMRANFSDLLAPGFREIYFDKFNSYPNEYKDICNLPVTAKRQYQDDSTISGFGAAPEKDEGTGAFYDAPIQGYDTRYTHKTRGIAFRVTREMWDDDLYGKMKKMPASMAWSIQYSIETAIANIYNRAFNSSYTGGDGKELCATDHPLTGGGTEQNELTNASDLNEVSLEQALIDIAATTNDRGLLLALKPKTMLVTPTNNVNAHKLLKSTQEPGSANNAHNFFNGIMPYTVNHYLTDTDAWFILCEDHEVNCFIRRKPDLEQGNDFDTQDAKFIATARWSEGWSFPWGIFGSPGQ